MSTKEQRRQKKLAKKRSKQVIQRKQQARERNMLQSLAGQIKAASTGAVEHCMIADRVTDSHQKHGSILISRWMQDRRLACVRFLIDGMCLGVKDVHGFTCFPASMAEYLEKVSRVESFHNATPERARKLVESAIAYAHQFDLQPHPDYRKVAAIWGDIDSGQCEEEFEFGGENGKPNYISGPDDTRLFQSRVIERLERTAGPGNYNYIYLGSEDSLADENDYYIDDPELDVDIDEDVEDYLIDRH
jgi:hypothetical protein